MTAPRQAQRLLQRLHNQHVSGEGLATPEDVVRLLGAVQSQDYPGAKWSVGQRVKDGTDAVVEEAFADGRMLRTHLLRPTWHFVTPVDIRWILQLTAPRVHGLNAHQYRRLELGDALLRKSRTIFTRALRDGSHRTRPELAALLERAGIAAHGLRLGYIMMHAELEGLVCSGSPRGKHQTYALLDERAPDARLLARDETLGELAHRFFTGHAPATLEHFVWWSGLSVTDAKRGLASVAHRLTRERAGDADWYGSDDRPPPASARSSRPAAHLIPEYDEALTGYRDLGVPDMPRSERIASWSDTFFRPVIVGGRRAGTWRRTVTKREVVIDLNLFAALDAAQTRSLRATIERYGEFVGMPVSIA